MTKIRMKDRCCSGPETVKRLAESPPPRFELMLVALTLCGLAVAAPLYGFNVYLSPLLDEFSSSDNNKYTMQDGSPVYVAGFAILVANLANFFVAPRVETWGYSNVFGLGLVLAVVGLVLTYVSVFSTQLWLLYVGYGVVFGTGAGIIYLVVMLNGVLWFRARHDRAAIGSGMIGLVAGLWPAAFAYYGTALQERAGIADSFWVLAILIGGLGAWVMWLLYPPQSIGYKKNDATDETQHQSKKPRKAAVNQSPPNARSDNALSGPDVIKSRQFWLTLFLFFLALFPGFGMKLVLSPMLEAVYDADSDTQTAASFMFLASYAIMRLVMGLIADRWSVRPLLLICLSVQALICLVLGIIVWYANDSGVWGFSIANMILGCTLAGIKVLFSVFVLTIFGAPSMGASSGRLMMSFGLAAFLAPITIWAVLVTANETLSVNGSGSDAASITATRFTESVSIWFWVCTSATLLAIVLLQCIRPMPFQPLTSPSLDVERAMIGRDQQQHVNRLENNNQRANNDNNPVE